jgi:hypothetical protein
MYGGGGRNWGATISGEAIGENVKFFTCFFKVLATLIFFATFLGALSIDDILCSLGDLRGVTKIGILI